MNDENEVCTSRMRCVYTYVPVGQYTSVSVRGVLCVCLSSKSGSGVILPTYVHIYAHI